MASTIEPTQCEFSCPSGLRPSFVKRVVRGLFFSLIAFCMGVAATLTWESYGNVARKMIAYSFPQLDLAPQTASLARPASDSVAPPTLATPSPELEQLKVMSLRFAI